MKYPFKKIHELEINSNIWSIVFNKIPIWFYLRGKLLKGVPDTTIIPIDFMRMWQSVCGLVRFFFIKKKFKEFYFISGRDRLVNTCSHEMKEPELSCVFIKYEQGDTARNFNLPNEYDAYALEFIRFIFRKVSYLFDYKQYRIFTKEVLDACQEGAIEVSKSEVSAAVKNTLADSYFLRFLKYFIVNEEAIVGYSCCVVPMGEKFVNKLNSFEIQHGVIHAKHPGYAYVPNIANDFLLYDETYSKILKNIDYSGHYRSSDFNSYGVEPLDCEKCFIVFFTGVCQLLSTTIEKAIANYPSSFVKIKTHPRDPFQYQLASDYFINSYSASEIEIPLMVNSTVIDDFTIIGKKVFIMNIPFKEKDELASYIFDLNVTYDRSNSLNFEVISDIDCFLKKKFKLWREQ